MKLYDWITLTGALALLGVLGNVLGGLLHAPFIWHKYAGLVIAVLVLIHAGFVLNLKYGKKASK